MSSLLEKWRYTAPGLSPASLQISFIEVWWNPLRAKQFMAASIICSRRACRCSSVTLGTFQYPLTEKNNKKRTFFLLYFFAACQAPCGKNSIFFCTTVQDILKMAFSSVSPWSYMISFWKGYSGYLCAKMLSKASGWVKDVGRERESFYPST